jgi:VWFA-related protein
MKRLPKKRLLQNKMLYAQVALILFCMLPGPHLLARQAQNPCSGTTNQPLALYYNSVDASGFPRIVSYVTVTNDSNLAVGQLDSSHFFVQEDGVREYPIEVVDLTAEGEAITVVLVMDRSGSMDDSDLMDGAIDAAATFVGLLGENDQAGLVSFGSDVRIDHLISVDKASVIKAIRSLKAKGGTLLYDGILEAAKLLDAHQAPGRKALVVLSDGHSKEDSDISFENMLAWVEKLGFPVYTIGLKERGGVIEKNLITLACRTGGQYYYSPKTDDLAEIYRAIVEMLRHQYRITYTTHNPARDGSRRQVRITVNALGHAAADTNSYFAPFNLITLSPVTNDILSPGRTFEIQVIIPESSKPVYEMKDLTFNMQFDPQYLSVLQPFDQGLFAGVLFGAPGEHKFSYSVNPSRGEITFTLSKEAAAGLVNGKGEIARVIFQASTDLPDSMVFAFELASVLGRDDSGLELPFKIENLYVTSNGLTVWPGDTDHNGKVELRDVLPLGVHWALTGPGRPDEPNPLVWKAQLTKRYPVRMAAYADADGSGEVSERDIIPVGLNWGKTATASLFKKTGETIARQVLTGQLRKTLSPTAMPDVFKLGIFYEGESTAPICGLAFKLVLLRSGTNVKDVKYGPAWPVEPLLVAHFDNTTNKLGVGIVYKAGSSLPVNGDELVSVYFESRQIPNADNFALENIAVVTPDGKVHEIEEMSRNTSSFELPDEFLLYPAFPNPFNPSTILQYALPAAAQVEISIFDAAGRQVLHSARSHEQAGLYFWQWDGKDNLSRQVGSGLYLLRFTARTGDGRFWHARQKVTLMK